MCVPENYKARIPILYSENVNTLMESTVNTAKGGTGRGTVLTVSAPSHRPSQHCYTAALSDACGAGVRA